MSVPWSVAANCFRLMQADAFDQAKDFAAIRVDDVFVSHTLDYYSSRKACLCCAKSATPECIWPVRHSFPELLFSPCRYAIQNIFELSLQVLRWEFIPLLAVTRKQNALPKQHAQSSEFAPKAMLSVTRNMAKRGGWRTSTAVHGDQDNPNCQNRQGGPLHWRQVLPKQPHSKQRCRHDLEAL